jgi:hypothetical protein
MMSNQEQAIREVIDRFKMVNYDSEVFKARLVKEINERLVELEKNA